MNRIASAAALGRNTFFCCGLLFSTFCEHNCHNYPTCFSLQFSIFAKNQKIATRAAPRRWNRPPRPVSTPRRCASGDFLHFRGNFDFQLATKTGRKKRNFYPGFSPLRGRLRSQTLFTHIFWICFVIISKNNANYSPKRDNRAPIEGRSLLSPTSSNERLGKAVQRKKLCSSCSIPHTSGIAALHRHAYCIVPNYCIIVLIICVILQKNSAKLPLN